MDRVYNDIQEGCGVADSDSSCADVRQGSVGINHSINFLPDAERLSVVNKSAFADILSEVAWSHT